MKRYLLSGKTEINETKEQRSEVGHARGLPDPRPPSLTRADIRENEMAVVPSPLKKTAGSEVQTLHNLSFKQEARSRVAHTPETVKDSALIERRENLQGELNRTRSELHAAAEERDNMVRAYEDYIEKLQRENRHLVKSCGSDKSDMALSRKLQDIELQNDRIMENLRSTTATLSENEKSYIGKINLLFSEKQVLEQQISSLQQKMHESEVQKSRYEQLKQQFREVNKELEAEREKSIELTESEKALHRRVDHVEAQIRERVRRIAALESELEQLKEENRRLRAELADCQKLRDTELRTLNDRLERLIAVISAKDTEIDQLRKEINRSSGVGKTKNPIENSRRRDEEYEIARKRNTELAHKLEELSQRYDEMIDHMGSSRHGRAHVNHLNPFAASEAEAPLNRRQNTPAEYGETGFTPVKHREEDASTSAYSARSPVDHRKEPAGGDQRPPNLLAEHSPSANRAFQPLMTSDGKKEQVSRVLINGKVVYSANSTDSSINDPAAVQQYVNALAAQELKKLRTSLRSSEQKNPRQRNVSNPARLEQTSSRQVFGESFSNGKESYQVLQEQVPTPPAARQQPSYHNYFNK